MKKFITPLTIFFVSFLPTLALAAPATYDLLAPIGTLSGKVTLTSYLQGVFQTAIGITGVLAVIMIVICGISLMGTGSVAGKSEAKQCIWNAVFGILLAIGSWLLLNTINPLLLKNDAQLGVSQPAVVAAPPPATGAPIPNIPGWYFRYKDMNGNTANSPRTNYADACLAMQKIEKAKGTTITDECFEISKPAFGAPLPPPSATIPPPTQSGSEKATRNALCGNDSCVGSKPLGINHNACINGEISGCTNVAGLDAGVVSFLKTTLTGACGCEVVITGGTEDGHSSHGPNIPVFDLRKNNALNNLIMTNATVKNNSSFCYTNSSTCFVKWLYKGYWFTDETLGAKRGSHWHVCKDGTTAPAGKSVSLFIKACTKI